MTGATERPRRAALITGAARGLPAGIAEELARAGYRIAFTYRPDGSSPEQTLARVRAHDAEAVAIPADHGREGETKRAVGLAEDALGRIDVFVHGVGPLHAASFSRSTFADYRATIETNLSSAIEAAFAVLRGMRERKFGRLVFFGMNGSHATTPGRTLSLYGAAKAGVVAFARTLALEEARHGITVNVVEPGDIREKTRDRKAARKIEAHNPTGHAGSWEDVAHAVRFLVGDEAGFINGAVLGVNGGLTLPEE